MGQEKENIYWQERLARFIRSQVADHGAGARTTGSDQGQSGVAGDLVSAKGVEPRGDLRQDEKGDSRGNAYVSDKAPNGIQGSGPS